MTEDGGTRPVSLAPEQLAQINRLSTTARFVSGLAHELNNSLQVMSGLVELLADRSDLPPDVSVRIQKIGGQTDRASAVIRQVLAYVRESGGERATVDLAGVMDRALALRRYQLGRAGITVDWIRDPNTRFRVFGDERQLHQVFINLLMNAEESLTGQPQRHLHVSLTRTAGQVHVRLADSGPGVPQELRSKIFEPFFTTRGTERAVGLGLTVSAGIVAGHGGRLYLSDASPGATFVVELPERP